MKVLTKVLLLMLVIFLVFFAALVLYLNRFDNKDVSNVVLDKQSKTDKNKVNSSENTNSQNALSVTGVLRFSGLSNEEKDKLKLKYSNFIVTNLDTENLAKLGKDIGGIYLEEIVVNYKTMVGKCVEVRGAIKDGWNNVLNSQIDGQFTYNYLAFIPKDISTIDFSKCDPYKNATDNGQKDEAKLSFSGRIDKFVRPAPDIGYDYSLILTKPYLDNNNASGLPQMQKSLILIPANNEVWKFIETNFGKTLYFEGNMRWGYAESKYFEAVSVSGKPFAEKPIEL